ncbi:MAG: hypothetical protein DMF63_00945 [Acidobacteria bacterium]|nr:MAG: hypothetical protein DMF63_00945 [Acidobacteriota bacterium]
MTGRQPRGALQLSIRRRFLMSPQEDKKQKMLDRVAADNGVAIVVLDENSREVSVSNNNSICRSLTASPEFAPRCAEYCGVAFGNTLSGSTFKYECYAGLRCTAVPVADRGKRFVAIVGRTFNSADNYRKATDRAISDDWSTFPPNDFFENVLIGGSEHVLERAAAELSKFQVTSSEDILELAPPSPKNPPKKSKIEVAQPEPDTITALIEKFKAANEPVAKEPEPVSEADARRADAIALRALYGKLASLSYEDACAAALEFIAGRTGSTSLIWSERKENRLVPVISIGSLKDEPIRIGITADNQRLIDAARQERPVELRERIVDVDAKRSPRTLFIFASSVGGEIRGALGVVGAIDDAASREIALFCRRIGPQIEILKLRREVSTREWLNRAVSRFNESLKRIDADDFWTHVTQVSAELIQSERASLLLHTDPTEGFRTKAAIGAKINLFSEKAIGERVARVVLDDGNPVVVEDITRIGIKAAPPSWKYKTSSFLSYPIVIGDRRIGVMNFTDKANGDAFNERDLELLQAIAPQIAVAIDRTVLKDQAGEFEQLSVTDPLTGLLNRRYLEKRLIEEIQRSKRHHFPMSLMMLDVDEFKSYNDTFGHPAGDTALKMVADILHGILRGDDVAARYGGEEFAILLPQTTLTEAAAIAERLRQRIEHTEFPKRRVTVSIGIAACSNEIETPTDIVSAADNALYDAKNHGRNNVRIYDGFGKPVNERFH